MSTKEIIVPESEWRTSNILSIHECAHVLIVRVIQIESGSTIFTDYDGITDAYNIAVKELLDGKSPIIIKRFYFDDDDKYIEFRPVRFMAVCKDVIDQVKYSNDYYKHSLN